MTDRVPFITADQVEGRLNWALILEALKQGHQMPRADIADIHFKQNGNALLSRAAWIPGNAIGVKTATIFPGNTQRETPLPSVHAVVTLFDDQTGQPEALIDGALVTRWKTAGDSVLGAKLLARTDSRVLTLVGAGSVCSTLVDAYREIFPQLEEIRVWNRTYSRAEALANEKQILAVTDLEESLKDTDIVSCATLATEPVLKGDWVQPGTHVDLIGAFRADMREADDQLIRKSSVFVDARETTIDEIGELIIPIASGVLSKEEIKADLYDLCQGATGRRSSDEITLFKNGGGAHLDLMTALCIKNAAS